MSSCVHPLSRLLPGFKVEKQVEREEREGDLARSPLISPSLLLSTRGSNGRRMAPTSTSLDLPSPHLTLAVPTSWLIRFHFFLSLAARRKKAKPQRERRRYGSGAQSLFLLACDCDRGWAGLAPIRSQGDLTFLLLLLFTAREEKERGIPLIKSLSTADWRREAASDRPEVSEIASPRDLPKQQRRGYIRYLKSQSKSAGLDLI